MRCRYCFESIPDFSAQCPACGSKLPDNKRSGRPARPEVVPPPSTSTRESITESPDTCRLPLTGRQMRMLAGGGVFLMVCLCFTLVAVAAPGLLPQPVFVVLPFLASPTPLPTPQVTRAPVATPTPIVLVQYPNENDRFTISFPAGWLVVDQEQAGWRDRVRDMGETYSWAETLFETAAAPAEPQMRAIDPAIVDLANGRLVLFTAAQVDLDAGTVTMADIETLAAEDPAGLAALAGGLTLIGNPQDGYNVQAIRTARVKVSGRGALLVEFEANSRLRDRPVRVVVRLYFVPDGNNLYVITYLADENAFRRHEALYDQIVQSFVLVEH